ncbi:MAG: ung [Chlamydiales bacterium]|jgi:uracil-DNA glycosylase|nr:ung [Chlamydiales bacterium]
MKSFPIPLEKSWLEQLKDEFKKPYIGELLNFLESEWSSALPIYPPKVCIFNAFNYTPFDQVKVVLIGQDPYHGANQAHGLSFSVMPGVRQPPSLKNIFKELQDDLGCTPPNHGFLAHWAKQGVLLLNAVLTVREGKPASHSGKGWEQFTDAAIQRLAHRQDPVIFMLWGKFAQQKVEHITALERQQQHIILKAAHPSPYSAFNGFFGCHHFSQANEILKQWGQAPIDWQIPLLQ